ncbi:Nitric oxide synthase, brain [Chamberlinius hualienensis]
MFIDANQQPETILKLTKLTFGDDNNNNQMMSGEIKDFYKSADKCCEMDNKAVDLTNFRNFKDLKDTLHNHGAGPITSCTGNVCYNGKEHLLDSNKIIRTPEEVAIEAKRFLDQYYATIPKSEKSLNNYEKRLLDILKSIQKTGTYDLTSEELEFGVRLAYRNSSFITDRWQWETLKVFDCQHINTVKEMFEAICNQLKYVTNNGSVCNAVTVFPKAQAKFNGNYRIWNSKLISYAGYQQEDGSVVGDPAQLKLTQICESIGWISPSNRAGSFDVLPLLISAPEEDPKYFNIPNELVLQIDITHPQYKWFEDLGLKWFAVNAPSDMVADIGGLRFTAAPFTGVQLSAEVATRDLCDPYRYNILEDVAFRMGLDTMSIVNLWKDQALVEINIAVIHSFKVSNVDILDHHTASELFSQYLYKEYQQRGGCPANWTAIVPPLSSGLTNVFHQEMLLYRLKPCFEKQEVAWKNHNWTNESVIKVQNNNKVSIKSAASAISLAQDCMKKILEKRVKATIVYASETGKSEMFARRLGQLFQRAFNYEVVAMDEYNLEKLPNEELILVVASTFGSGDAPQNGKMFSQYLSKTESNSEKLKRVPKFAVFALGSSAYPDFCAFGKFCDESLENVGYKRVIPVATADEIKSQEKSFKTWANEIFRACCDAFEIRFNPGDDGFPNEEDEDIESIRIVRASQPKNGHDLAKGLSEIHQKNVALCSILSRTQLQSSTSDRQTVLVQLDSSRCSLNYLPGDHLGVFPSNPTDLVRAICLRLKQLSGRNSEEAAKSEVVSIRTVDRENLKEGRVQTWKDAGKIPPCTIWTALTNYLDITTPPTQSLLKKLSEAATNNGEQETLMKLAQNDEMYESWKSEKYPSLVDVLEEFPSVCLDLRVVLSQVPLLQPRFYSISSSPQLHSSQIHLTVGVLTYQLQGKLRKGVCSNFLNDATSPVPCFVRSANFRMPKQSSKPIIMIGPGTGIAPFRSFWQQRQYDVQNNKNTDEKFGKMILYFGCRKPGVDDIYSKELQTISGNKYNFQAKVAYSRADNRPKTYVQQLLENDSQEVYDHLTIHNGNFYICGEAAMAADVRNTLKNILKVTGKMNTEESSKFLQKLKDEGRFQEDIFGVLVKSSS